MSTITWHYFCLQGSHLVAIGLQCALFTWNSETHEPDENNLDELYICVATDGKCWRRHVSTSPLTVEEFQGVCPASPTSWNRSSVALQEKKSSTWETLLEDIEPIPMKIEHNKVPYQKSQELRKCWCVCVIAAWPILVPCGKEDHDHFKLKNWNLLGSDCCLDVAEGVETPMRMLTCWSMGLSGDWLGQLILVTCMYLLSGCPKKGVFTKFRTSPPPPPHTHTHWKQAFYSNLMST